MPASSKPFLDEIDPKTFALDVYNAVYIQVMSMANDIGCTINVSSCCPAPDAPIYKAAFGFAFYAQHGIPVDEVILRGYSVDSLFTTLWHAVLPAPERLALTLDTLTPDYLADYEQHALAGIVLRAAHCRMELEKDHWVSSIELAILGSSADDHVSKLCRNGKLKATKGEKTWSVAPVAARRWLASRNVPGF